MYVYWDNKSNWLIKIFFLVRNTRECRKSPVYGGWGIVCVTLNASWSRAPKNSAPGCLKPLIYVRFSFTLESRIFKEWQLNPKTFSENQSIVRKSEYWKEITSELKRCHATNTHYIQQYKSWNTTNCKVLQLRFILQHICTLYKSLKFNLTTKYITMLVLCQSNPNIFSIQRI